MKEAKLLGKLMQSHPDVLPILEEIREKYNIPPHNKFHQKVTPLYRIFP